MSALTQKWTDFSKGDCGWVDKGAFGQSSATVGFWTGEQVMLYRDGSVGPRSGLVDLAPTGLPSGTIYGIGYVNADVSGGVDYLWIHKGTHLCTIPVYDALGRVLTGQAAVLATGTFAATPTGGVTDHVDYSPTTTIFTLDGDTAYKADWTSLPGGTLTALSGAPGGANVDLFDEFLVLAGTVGNTNRVFYSMAGDFNTWPPANFFDISGGLTGAGAPKISAMRVLRTAILLWTDLGQLFIVTNLTSDPTTTTIRPFMPGDTMSGPEKKAIVRTREGNVWWTRRDTLPFIGDQAFDAPTAVPVSFDGSTRTEDVAQSGYLRQPDFTNDRLSRTSAVSGRQEKSVVLLDYNGRALVGRADGWSRHNLGAVTVDGHLIAPGLRGEVFMANVAGSDLYAWQFELDRPPWKFSGSAAEHLAYSPLDAGSAMAPAPWFATPELRLVNGGIQSVLAVEVIFTTFATRDSLTNHFDVFVQQYDRVDADEQQQVGTVVPPDSATTGSPPAMISGGVTVGCSNNYDVAPDTIDHRKRVRFFPLPDQLPCQGLRVLLKNLRGVAIHEIHLFGDTYTDARP